MRLLRLYQIMGLVTTVAVVYIHMHMQIIDLAYKGKTKEQQIRKLIEQNGNITYQILSLKSAKHLGVKMFAENSSMHFVDPNNIVEISTPQEQFVGRNPEDLSRVKRTTNPLLSLLSFGSQAEARIPE